MDEVNFLDTDMFIHCLSADPILKRSAEKVFRDNHFSAMSAFSLLELKGNYIQDMELLYRKINDSDSLQTAFAKIMRIGGRKSGLMLAMLIKWIGNFTPHPWNEAKKELLTYLDSQLGAAWGVFKSKVDVIYDDFKCSRALEEPVEDGDVWRTTIPHCTDSNTQCKIAPFMDSYKKELIALVEYLDSLSPELKTDELKKIREVAVTTISKGFPWRDRVCRKVGDLLIGLQSKSGIKLITSNYKEHGQLHVPLNYSVEHFNVVANRTK